MTSNATGLTVESIARPRPVGRELTASDFTTDRHGRFVLKTGRRARRAVGFWLFATVVSVIGLARGLSRGDIRRLLGVR